MRTSPRVARVAASDSAYPASVPPIPPTSESTTSSERVDPRADLVREPVGRDRDAAADRLADDEHVGIQTPETRGAGGAGTDRVGLVDDQERAGPAGDLAHRVEVARFGQHDPDVREGGLDEHGRHVAIGEGGLESGDVVELDHARGPCDVHLGPDRTVHRHDRPVLAEDRDRLVDRPVVAVVVDDDLGTAGDVASQAEREPVRVRGGQRELPGRQPEPSRQLLADPGRVLGREHVGDPEAHLALDRRDRRGRPVAGHRPRVAEAEVHVVVTVDASEGRARSGLDVGRERAGPLHHPGHGNALEE